MIVPAGEDTDPPPSKKPKKANQWYNSNTYECLKCGWLGNYYSVDRHILKTHGVRQVSSKEYTKPYSLFKPYYIPSNH